MRKMTRGLAVLFALGMACSPERGTVGTDAPTIPVVDLSMSDGVFQAPDTLDAGLTMFRFANQDGEIHYAHAVRLDSSRTVPEFLAAYAEAVRTAGPRPTYITRAGGPGGTAPGDTSAVTHVIEPGHYVWICPVDDRDGTPHFASGEARSFVVRAAASNAVAPSPPVASGVIRLVNYGFTLDEPLTAGSHTLRVVNEGPDAHDLVMVRLEAGKTIHDLQSWLRDANGPPPFASVGGVAVLAPKMEAWVAADLTQGDYALFCMATAQDGRTHIEHGMIQQIRVS